MEPLYIPNASTSIHSVPASPKSLAGQALEHIVTNYPPRSAYEHSDLHGICAGPTAIAYLFLHVSAADPHLRVAHHSARTWAKAYISAHRGHTHISPGGLFSEKLSHTAVLAAITQDASHVERMMRYVGDVLDRDAYDELLYGLAGVLYLLRLIRHWVPESASTLQPTIGRVTEKVLAHGPNWTFHGKRYIGAAHGDIGILTQLVLTTPMLAPRLQPILERLLSLQQPDGHWTSRADGGSRPLVQWCHGAPGFLISLLSLRDFFPGIQGPIDAAIEKGREMVWREGLLRKEPCLCHGIFGNALVFPPGLRRMHFLAHATPPAVEESRSNDPTMFQPAESGRRYSLMMDYWPGAAWAWMVAERSGAKMILYNDV